MSCMIRASDPQGRMLAISFPNIAEDSIGGDITLPHKALLQPMLVTIGDDFLALMMQQLSRKQERPGHSLERRSKDQRDIARVTGKLHQSGSVTPST